MLSDEVTMVQRRFRRILTSPAIAYVLIAALFVGGLPMLSGLVVAPDSRPAFTLDICHPIGGTAHGVATCEAPLIPTQQLVQLLPEFEIASEFVIGLSSRPDEAPTPPPPKVHV